MVAHGITTMSLSRTAKTRPVAEGRTTLRKISLWVVLGIA